MVCADGSDPVPSIPFDPDCPKFGRKYGLQRVPWQDRLSMHDAGAAGVTFVDVWTLAQATLAAGKWHAEFLGSDAVVIEDASLQERDPHTKLGRDVLQAMSGELFLCSVARDGIHKVLESFDDFASSHEVGTASISVGLAGALASLG